MLGLGAENLAVVKFLLVPQQSPERDCCVFVLRSWRIALYG